MDNERTIKGSEDRPLARGTETSTTRTDDVSRPAATGTGAVVGGTAGGLAGATAAGAAAGGMTGPIGAVVGAAAGARVHLMRDEREKFLAQEWPRVRSTIERLGLDVRELLKKGSGSL